MNFFVAMPTPQDTKLWTKVAQISGKLTAEERCAVLRKADPATQVTNTLKVSVAGAKDIEEKALTRPESMTYNKCQLIQDGYRIWNSAEQLVKSDSMVFRGSKGPYLCLRCSSNPSRSSCFLSSQSLG